MYLQWNGNCACWLNGSKECPYLKCAGCVVDVLQGRKCVIFILRMVGKWSASKQCVLSAKRRSKKTLECPGTLSVITRVLDLLSTADET